MSTFSQFSGGEGRLASIVHGFGTRSTLANVMDAANATTALSGAMTAGTLKSVLSISGSGGRLLWLGARTMDATSRTIRIRVTLDSTVVFDQTSAAIATSGSGVIAVGGGLYTSDASALFQPLRFYTSCLVEVASSVTETDKVTIGYSYEVLA